LSIKHSILSITDVKLNFNERIVSINYTVVNDKMRGIIANITFNNQAVVTKLWIYLTIRTPTDENDKNFRKKVLQTVFNTEKILSGKQTGFVAKTIMAQYLKASESELKFPMKVSCPMLPA
jgi:hypothetical protein